jgi:hypothetical protein
LDETQEGVDHREEFDAQLASFVMPIEAGGTGSRADRRK